jgi:cytochrome c peroxidase
MSRRTLVWLLGAGFLAGAVFAAEPQGLPGENPDPIHLVRPPAAPLSAMAKLGREIFFDMSLSSSGKMSCASCHSPDHAYGPPNDGPVMHGGPTLTLPGARAVPSLTYLERQPGFGIGPDDRESENVNLAEKAALGQTVTRVEKTATQTSQSVANIVPQGGLFWTAAFAACRRRVLCSTCARWTAAASKKSPRNCVTRLMPIDSPACSVRTSS